MKKILITAMFALLLGTASQMKAQDCNALVLPHVAYNQDMLNEMPAAKIAWYCSFSRNSFFFTNEVPAGAAVYNISDVVDVRTHAHLPANYVVDVNVMSYYAYNFNDFQSLHFNQKVYFRIGNSDYHYLGLYSYTETMTRTGEVDYSTGRNE